MFLRTHGYVLPNTCTNDQNPMALSDVKCLFFVYVYLGIQEVSLGAVFYCFFQRQLSIIKFTLNYPPIRNNLTSASLLSMLIETDYLNYPPIRNNISSTSLPLSCAGAILKILQYLIIIHQSETIFHLQVCHCLAQARYLRYYSI